MDVLFEAADEEHHCCKEECHRKSQPIHELIRVACVLGITVKDGRAERRGAQVLHYRVNIVQQDVSEEEAEHLQRVATACVNQMDSIDQMDSIADFATQLWGGSFTVQVKTSTG